jgi:hypothetical protein
MTIGIQNLYALKEPGKLEFPNPPPANHTSIDRKAGGGSRDFINVTNQITDKSTENALDSAATSNQSHQKLQSQQQAQNGGLEVRTK